MRAEDDPRAEIARQDALRAGMTRRPGLQTVLLVVIGAVFGAVGTLTWREGPSGSTVAGTVAAIDPTGSAITVEGAPEVADVGLGIVGVLWRDPTSDGWQRRVTEEGFPTCLTPEDVGREVVLGLVTDPGGADRPSSTVVAWIECGPA